MITAVFIAVATGFLSLPVFSRNAEDGFLKSEYIPEIHGTVRAKYEYGTGIGKGRFEVRNARMAVEGKVMPAVRYKAEIDLSDEGAIKMLDAYVRLRPEDKVSITVGQMRVPFTIDSHRSPHLQFFANRSFIAKQAGNVRDVGVAVSWTPRCRIPVMLEGGIFNGSGLTDQKDYWTDNYNFSFKAAMQLSRQFNVTLSCQKANAGDAGVIMYDAGTYWENSRWHIEAEYLRKHYSGGAFAPVDAVDAFVVYRFPVKKLFNSVSILGRYDYMSDHSRGGTDAGGNLTTDDPERHRLTGGVTLSLGNKSLQADLRLNYEQYFYADGVIPAISEQNKMVAEFVVHF